MSELPIEGMILPDVYYGIPIETYKYRSPMLIRGVPYYKTESLWKSLTCIAFDENPKIKH